MPLQFSLEVLGEEQINRTFLRMADNANDLAPLWERMLKELRAIEEMQFASEGSHGSGGWPPLAESTVEKKRSMNLSPMIERATEALFKSLTGGAGGIEEVSRDWLRFGTTIPYAGYQQSGTRLMPQRRLVQLTEEERKAVAKMVQRFIVTGAI